MHAPSWTCISTHTVHTYMCTHQYLYTQYLYIHTVPIYTHSTYTHSTYVYIHTVPIYTHSTYTHSTYTHSTYVYTQYLYVPTVPIHMYVCTFGWIGWVNAIHGTEIDSKFVVTVSVRNETHIHSRRILQNRIRLESKLYREFCVSQRGRRQ